MNWTEEIEEDQPGAPDADVTRRTSVLRPVSVLVVLLLVLAIGGAGFALGRLVHKPPASLSTSPQNANSQLPFGGDETYPPVRVPSSSGSPSSTGGQAAASIAKSVDKGLVDINTTLSYQGATASGTGMLLTSNGLVLTNNHVIAGATSITARDVATNTVYKAKVVGYDVTKDVAVLQLQNASGLATVTLGNSSSVTVGQQVVGIGNAGGVGGTPSFNAGSVIALDQSITASDSGSPTGGETLTGLIAVNAAVQPGDSGGPLVNTSGQVIAMDTAGSSSNGGFGYGDGGASPTSAYAIPITAALAVATSIEKGQSSSTVHIGATAFLGVEVSPTPTGEQTGSTGASQGLASGATVVATIPGTPAASSALVAGDVITSVNGESVTSTSQLAQITQGLNPGDSVRVGYVNRSGVKGTLTLQLASGPPQ